MAKTAAKKKAAKNSANTAAATAPLPSSASSSTLSANPTTTASAAEIADAPAPRPKKTLTDQVKAQILEKIIECRDDLFHQKWSPTHKKNAWIEVFKFSQGYIHSRVVEIPKIRLCF